MTWNTIGRLSALALIILGISWGMVRPNAAGPTATGASAAPSSKKNPDVIHPLPVVHSTGQGGPGEAIAVANSTASRSYPDELGWWLRARQDPARQEALRQSLAEWTSEAPHAALHWLETEATGLERAQWIAESVIQWAGEDRAEAATWVEGMADDATKQSALEALLTAWPANELPSAAAWLDSGTLTGSIREAGRVALLLTWANLDWEAALAWYAPSETPSRLHALADLMASEGARQTDRAAALLDGTVDPVHRSALATAWLGAVAAQAPDAGLNWLKAQKEASPDWWSGFFYEWAQHDPPTAFSALETNAPAAVRENAAFAVFLRWAASDAASASAGLATLGEASLRDAAIEGFSSGLVAYDPETSLIWAAELGDDELREAQKRALLSEWVERDAAAAARWLSEQTGW